MDATNVKVEFSIFADDLNHDMVSEHFGMLPDHIRYKSEVLRNGRVFGYDVWGIETEYESSLDIDIQLRKVTDKIIDKADIINDLCKKFNAKCSFVIVVNVENGEFPAMHLRSDFIEFAASVNADIGFDPYFFSNCD